MTGKRFKFDLENVLKLRRHETERARQMLVDAAMERERHESLLADSQRRLREIAMSAASHGTVGSITFRQHDAFRRDAHRAFEQAARALKQKQQAEDEARKQLVEHRRAEEALQNLHDQKREAHLREQETVDLAFLDEQALSSFARKRLSA